MKLFTKLAAALLVSVLSISPVFARTGIMAGEGNVQMVQTKWFDIIFGDEAKDSANILYANADQIYQDLADMYGWTQPPCRMPVILTTQVEIFNAYFSTGSYNHIVLYVTNPVNQLTNQPDTFLWTFRHELTHAYTYNMKGSFFKAVSNVLGDGFNFSLLTVTPGVAEGATVASESFEGNGRLNDEFSKQMVKQAKIEDKFPKFSDVQGSRDFYPAGGFYNFNGAFHEYLQREYGLEKYARFWYNCINNSLTVSGAFRKAYKLKLRKEWANFEKQYKVPSIPADPVKAGASKDLFMPDLNTYSLENSKGARFESISQSEKGITYVDDASSKVFFISKEDLKKSEVKPKLLFQFSSLNKATQSLDGKFVAIDYYNSDDINDRCNIAVYNTETKKWYKPKYHGVKEAIVVKNGSDYYLVALKFKGEESSVKITKLLFDATGNICDESDEINFDFTRTQLCANFVPVKNGTFAYIMNDRLNYSVQLMNFEGKIVGKYDVPSSNNLNHFIMHYLSANNKNPNELYFSWVSDGTMPRVGKLNTEKREFTLSSEDLSGGIYYPVKYDDDLLYVGEFYEYNKLLKKPSEFAVNNKYQAKNADFSGDFVKSNGVSLNNATSVNTVPWEVQAYNPFNYLRGTFLPLSDLKSTSYDSQHKGSYGLPFGFTYTTSNPWDSLVYSLNVGYGFDTNSTGVGFSIGGGTGSGNISWQTTLFSEFDYKGWKAGDVSLTGTYSKSLTNKLKLSVAPSVFFHSGRSNATEAQVKSYPEVKLEDADSWSQVFSRVGVYGNHDDLFYLFGKGSVTISVNNLRRVYDSRHSIGGFYAGILPSYYISYDMTNSAMDYNYGELTLFGECYIPRLIPIDCINGVTYNLPVKLFAAAFSASSVYSQLITVPVATADYSAPDLAMVATEVLLFGREFQSSVRFLPFLYFNDMFISGIASVGFDYKSHKNQSFGFLYTSDFVNEIANGTNKPMGIFAVKFSVGMNFTNFGSLARSASKNYINAVPVVIFKDFQSEPKFDFMFGIGLKF